MQSKHIVLAGDSIFDNDIYVPGEPGVLLQLGRALPSGWRASKVAVDGAIIEDVRGQTHRMPAGATDLVVSVGGNDALGWADLLWSAPSLDDLQQLLREPLAEFRAGYAATLDFLSSLPVRLQVCTIYGAVPFDDPVMRARAPAGVAYFNEVILDEAGRRGVNVLRLDRICTEPDDYSAESPIEPSAKGGRKIVDLIVASLS